MTEPLSRRYYRSFPVPLRVHFAGTGSTFWPSKSGDTTPFRLGQKRRPMPAVQRRPARPMGTSSNSRSKSQSGRRHSNVKTLGRYVVDKKVGEGGMGCVYRATDSQLDRTVALKVLPLEKAKDPRLVKRFRAEAQAAAALKHKNIIGVYDSGEIDGFLYIAMEYVDGIDVHELVKRRGVLDVPRSRDIMRQLARALQHAYEKDIVHRDIKPSNLMIDRDGKVRLADMGLARSLADSEKSGITRAGTTVGTVDYMSPEQTRDSRSADTRSDMYSLGATWYHMLTGGPPFPDGDLLNRINAHATQPPPNPQDVNDDVPDGVVEVMHRMLEKKPEDRYQTPADLLEALDRMSLKKRSEIDLGMLAGLMEEDDGNSSPGRKRPAKKKRPARKKARREEPAAEPVPEDDDSDDALYSFKPVMNDASEPDDDDESDMDLPLGEGAGDLNLGLLAALAEDDDEPESAPASPARRPTPRQSPGRQRTARRSPEKARSGEDDAKPSRREKPQRRKKERPRKESPRRDTMADDGDTDGALPSRRDVMLGRGSRHGRTGAAGSAIQSRKEMMAVAGIVIAVCIIGWFAVSAISGGAETPPPPETPALQQ